MGKNPELERKRKPLLILVAGKQATLNKALKMLLQTRPGLEITGSFVDKEALFAQLETGPTDLLLLDETLSKELVKEVIIPLQQFDHCPAILVLSDRVEARQAYLAAGVMAVINKGGSPKSLLTAIEEIRLRKEYV